MFGTFYPPPLRPPSPIPDTLRRVPSHSSGEDDSHITVLFAASEECVATIEALSRIAPQLSLSSVFARDVHTVLYLVGNVETALHQFVDRELLGTEPWVRRREQGARLQDALGRAGSLKSTVKASLLAGGIASLLHLFALTLRRLHAQLEALLPIEQSGDAYAEIATAAACGLALRKLSPRHGKLRAIAAALGAGCAARALLLRAKRRYHLQRLNATQERLSLVLQLWWLATSVLQRANKHKSASYIELDKLERSSSQNDKQGDEGSKYNNRRLSRELSPTNPGSLVSSRQSSKEENNLTSTALAMLRSSGSFGSSSERLAGHAREVAAAHGGPPTVRERNESNVSNSSSAVWQASLPPSRSYPQLIAMPGLQDIDDDHKNAMRQLYEICVPWSSQHVPHAFWWQVTSKQATPRHIAQSLLHPLTHPTLLPSPALSLLLLAAPSHPPTLFLLLLATHCRRHTISSP